MTRWLLTALALAVPAAACTIQQTNALKMRDGAMGASGAPKAITSPVLPRDLLVPLNNPADAHAELCSNDGEHPNFPDDADMITKTFCQDLKPGGVMPTPKGLADLLKQLGLDFKNANGGNGTDGNPAFAILGHSSALTARKISSLMPTAFIFTPPPADGSKPVGQYSAVGFDPGEQFVEVASFDPTKLTMNFYVVLFDQECNKAPGGCTHADLLTSKLVTGWSNVRVYEDTTALGNTILDCHVCHQPVDSAAPFLRMQENVAPFTHWFSGETEGGRALLADFKAAHTGDYGGIPAALIDKSDPAKLAALVAQSGAGKQPNAFPSAAIEAEVKASAKDQPLMNDPPGTSASWQALYDGAVAGRFIPPPYHDVKVTDPLKLSKMTDAYKQWLGGSLADLPDLREVFLDDGLRDMGFAAKAGLDGRGLLVQLCQQCHNANLDMTITRELFLTDKLDAMNRAERDVAIARLREPVDSRLVMPPPLFRSVTDEERQLMIDELSK